MNYGIASDMLSGAEHQKTLAIINNRRFDNNSDSVTNLRTLKTILRFIILINSAVLINGCALHYYDKETGAEHIYGFGHMVMKVTPQTDAHKAVVLGTDLMGLGFGQNREGGFLSFGWNSQRRIAIFDDNTTVDLIWPDSSFLNTRIGHATPQTDRILDEPKDKAHE